jgi:MFS family permease
MRADPVAQGPIGYRALLRTERDFRHLWLGDVSSVFGDWFNLIALYTAVQRITDSKLALAVVVLMKTAPNFLVMPLTGPLVDRFDRRRLLLVADFARAALVPGLIASHHVGSLLGLYAFTFLMICFTGLAFPARRAALPMVVPRERLGVANAVAGGTWSTMLVVGSLVGGLAVQFLGVTAALAIDGATFLASATWVARLPSLPAPAATHGDGRSFRDGLRYLRRQPFILATLACKPFMSFSSAVMVTIPVWGTAAFAGRSGPAFVGGLYAARGVGSAIGSLVPRIAFGDHPRALRRLILAGFVTVSGALTLVAHAPVYALAALGFMLAAIGGGGNWVFTGTLLQLEAEPSQLGRVFALDFGVSTLVLGAAGLLVGIALDWGMSLREVTQRCAIVTIPPATFWAATLAVMRRVEARASQGAAEPGAASPGGSPARAAERARG